MNVLFLFFSLRRCPECEFSTVSVREFRMHLSAFHGDQLYCGYGCNFSFPASAAYVYRRHLQQHHGGIFKAGTENKPQGSCHTSNPSEDSRHDSLKEESRDHIQPDVNNNMVIDDDKPKIEGEVVLNLLDDLLPPGCLSPLPDTPPRKVTTKKTTRVSTKGKVGKVTKLEAAVGRSCFDLCSDTPAEPRSSTRWDPAPSPMIEDTVPQWPAPMLDSLVVIDTRYDGKMPYNLTPISLPVVTFESRGKDPRIEGIILKRH